MIRHWVRNHAIKNIHVLKTHSFLLSHQLQPSPHVPKSSISHSFLPSVESLHLLSPLWVIKNLKHLLYKHAIEYFHFQNSSFILWHQSFGCSLKSRWHIPPCDLPSELQMGEMEREPMWSTQINTSTYNQAVCPFSVQHYKCKEIYFLSQALHFYPSYPKKTGAR